MKTKQTERTKKKGILSLLWESIAKSNEGCGPGCGCHAEVEKKPDGKTDAQPNKGK